MTKDGWATQAPWPGPERQATRMTWSRPSTRHQLGGQLRAVANAVTGAKVAANTLTTADIAGADVSGHVSLSGIANGRCTQVSFSVSGAAVGQAALVTTGAPIQNGIALYATRISAANIVEVNACNFSGTTMSAITNFPVRVVTLGWFGVFGRYDELDHPRP
jgi:hypothetical protein